MAEHLNDPKVVVLDATMDSIQGDNSGNANRRFIPGALLLDLKKVFACPDSPLQHTAPSYAYFRQKVRALGIGRDATVVVYDAKGIYSSPRGWWLFKLMGHEKVFVLDGGLPKWVAENRFLDTAPAQPSRESEWEGCYKASLLADKLVLAAASKAAEISAEVSIVDARVYTRFLGTSPEPREGLRAGHIPNSVNVPFEQVLENGCYKSPEALRRVFEEQKLSSEHTVYFSCGSGITACIVLLAAVESGIENVSLYDGSWAEWGADHALPISSDTT